MRRAKIVATLGPASRAFDKVLELAESGMDVARLNFSHGSRETHLKSIQHIRRASQETGKSIAIMQDLRGPKLRTGKLADSKSINLVAGKQVTLTPEPIPGTAARIHVDYKSLAQDVSRGDQILIDDGKLELTVERTEENQVVASVVVGGVLGENKGINLPGVSLTAPALTRKDLADLSFGLDQDVDLIAMSFVRHEDNIQSLRNEVRKRTPEDHQVPIIAKLEQWQALERLEAIIDSADGIMVARGDLGVEVSPERVPSLQKQIIAASNARQKPVVTATQMLESMMHNVRPSRAEASDIANAVFDGSDALMLSGETAIGDHPANVVRTMHRIILDAEKNALRWGYKHLLGESFTDDDALATAQAARHLAHDREAQAIAVFTRSGRTAELVSSVRPKMPILAFTPEQSTYRRLALAWGVFPHLIPMATNVEEMLALVEAALVSTMGLVAGQQFVLVASLPIGAMGPANFSYLHTVGQPFASDNRQPSEGE